MLSTSRTTKVDTHHPVAKLICSNLLGNAQDAQSRDGNRSILITGLVCKAWRYLNSGFREARAIVNIRIGRLIHEIGLNTVTSHMMGFFQGNNSIRSALQLINQSRLPRNSEDEEKKHSDGTVD